MLAMDTYLKIDPRAELAQIRTAAALRVLEDHGAVEFREAPVQALAGWIDPSMGCDWAGGGSGEDAVLLALQVRGATFVGAPDLASWRPLPGWPKLAPWVEGLIAAEYSGSILWPIWRDADRPVMPPSVGRFVSAWAAAVAHRKVPVPPRLARPERAEALRQGVVDAVLREPALAEVDLLLRLGLAEQVAISLLLSPPLGGEDISARVARRYGGRGRADG